MPTLQRPFASFDVVPDANVLVGRPLGGVTITFDDMKEVCALGLQQFRREPWVYISVRDARFDTDPTLYARLAEVDHRAVGFAVVTDDASQQLIAKYASGFGQPDVTVGFFDDVDAATTWARRLLLRTSTPT